MSSLQYLKVMVLSSCTNGAYEFCFEFCVVEVFKFWVKIDGLWNKEWQEPKIGDAHGTPR